MKKTKTNKKTNKKKVTKTTKAVDVLENSSVVEKKTSHHHHHKDRTPVFDEAVANIKAKKNIKKIDDIKKKNPIMSFFNDVTRKIGVGHISEENENNALLCDQMHFDAKEAYKLLRTNLLFCLPDNDTCRTIAITSAIRGEGKSTVSINLAYTFATLNSKVLLIDMDMRLPSIAKKLNITAGKGLSDYLIGDATLKEIIRTTDKYKNWDVILSGSIPPAPAELIGSDSMAKLIRRLEKQYDFIIIDFPPINVVSDALIAKDIVDGYLLTVRQDYSDKHSVSNCIRQLSFLNANVLGFIFTDANTQLTKYKKYGRYYGRYYSRRRYGYGYKYGYDYGYGYGRKPQEEKK